MFVQHQITPARVSSIWSQRQDPRNVPVITKIPTIRIFQPWLINVFNWSLMARPAKAPTMVKGAVKLMLAAAWITNSLTGEIGEALKSPMMEQ